MGRCGSSLERGPRALLRAGLHRHRLADVFADLNSNHDDVVTIEEIRGKTISLGDWNHSLGELLTPLQLEAGGEDVSLLPGLRLEEVDTCNGPDRLQWLEHDAPRRGDR